MPNRSKAKPKGPLWRPQVPLRVLAPTGPIWWAMTDRKEAPIVWPSTMSLHELATAFTNRLNMRPENSGMTQAQRWAMVHYADHGALPPVNEWPDSSRKEATAALTGYQFRWAKNGGLCFGYFGPLSPETANIWFDLAILQAHRIPIRQCPTCHDFFADTRHRGKTTCSIACGNKRRARTHLETLKAKPRKYQAYLKKQRDLMRERRAQGLA
jgi:hypothetical protein